MGLGLGWQMECLKGGGFVDGLMVIGWLSDLTGGLGKAWWMEWWSRAGMMNRLGDK